MKKYFFNGLLLFAVSFTATSFFSSCKDNLDDEVAFLENKDNELQSKIDQLEQVTKDLENAQKNCEKTCEEARKLLESSLKQYADAKDEDLRTKLAGEIAGLTSQIGVLEGDIATLKTQVATNKSLTDGYIADLQNQIDALKAATPWNSDVAAVNQKITEINQKIETINTEIDGITELVAAQNLQLTQKINDDLAALELKLKTEYTDLINNSVSDLRTELNATIENINSTVSSLNTTISTLSTTVEGLKADAAKGVETYNWMQTAKGEISSINTEIEKLKKEISSLSFEVDFTPLIIQIDSLATVTKAIEADYNALNTKLSDAIAGYDSKIAALNDKIAALPIAELENQIAALDQNVANAQADIQALELTTATLEQFTTTLSAATEELDSKIGDLTTLATANATAISTLQGDLNDVAYRTLVLESRLNNLITSILIQGVENPVFGTFNLPVGINSNIMFGYYGEATNNYTFPSYSAVGEYDGVCRFAKKDFEMLGDNINAYRMFQGDIMSEIDGQIELGTLYTTINPTDVDFSYTTFSVVNSQDVNPGIVLSKPVASDKVLSFGSTSRACGNGFYEMVASVPMDKANDLMLNVSVSDNLKQAVKDAYNNRTIGDFAELVQVVAQTIIDSENLQAYGLKAAWQYDVDGNAVNSATYSKYDLAAAIFKPFSYKFFYGQSIKNIPTISPLSGFEFDKSKFTFNFDAPTFNLDGVTFNFNLSAVEIGESADKITVKIEDFPLYDEATNTVTGTTTKEITVDIKNNIVAIENAFNDQIVVWNSDMQEAFKNAMKNLETDINTQIQDAIDETVGKVNDKIGNIIDKINGKADGAIDKANAIIKQVNKIINRLNNFLSDPNHYLQPMLAYENAKGNLSHVSTSKNAPTLFNVSNGDAISLFPTSYTSEILVPSFKKFVGVTNVWDADGNSAQDGNGDCLSVLKKANNNEFMATVVSGSTLEVPMAVKAGYVYEVVYSSLDYHGVSSTNKYYIKIK